MRKVYLLNICLLLVSYLSGQNPIPNPGFENWVSRGVPSYEDPQDWGTINSGTNLIGIHTATKASGADAHSGSYALRLETHDIGFPINQTAPGICASGTINQNTQEIEGGFVLNSRPTSLVGWFKYNPSSSDNCSVEVTIWKWNNTTHQRDEVGTGTFEVSNTVNSYTNFRVPIDYNLPDNPDSAVILLLSSNTNNPQDGSTFFVDDLAFCDSIGVSTASTGENCGSSDGTATVVSITGGTPPYTYLWDDPFDQTDSIATGLSAGTYNVIVVDAKGCAGTASVVVNNLGGLSATTTATDVSCYGADDGSVTANVSGGTPPYAYQWDDQAQQTAATAVNLGPGTYNVTLIDSNGCSFSTSATIGQPDSVVITAIASDVSCYGDNDGSVTADVSGGTPPYAYQWDDQGQQTTATAVNLSPGTYNVTVTDNNGCNSSTDATVAEPDSLSLTVAFTDESTAGANDGTAAATVTGGTGSYTYDWSDGSTAQNLTGLDPGEYCVTVTDDNGCTAIGCDSVKAGAVGISDLGNALGAKVYPTPANEFIVVESNTRSSLTLTLVDLNGKRLFDDQLSKGQNRIETSGLPAGIYFFHLISEEGDISNGKIVISR